MKSQVMTRYLQEVKTIVNNIAVAGFMIDPEDTILCILNGQPSTYQVFKVTNAPLSHISLDDFCSSTVRKLIYLIMLPRNNKLHHPLILILHGLRQCITLLQELRPSSVQTRKFINLWLLLPIMYVVSIMLICHTLLIGSLIKLY